MTSGEVVNDTIAVAAATNPWWISSIHGPSPTLALILQILGVVWLAIQITRFLYTTLKKK